MPDDLMILDCCNQLHEFQQTSGFYDGVSVLSSKTLPPSIFMPHIPCSTNCFLRVARSCYMKIENVISSPELFIHRLFWCGKFIPTFVRFQRTITQFVAFLLLLFLPVACQKTDIQLTAQFTCPEGCVCQTNYGNPSFQETSTTTALCISGNFTTWPTTLPIETLLLDMGENHIRHLTSVTKYPNNTAFRLVSSNLTSINLSQNHLQEIDYDAFILFKSLRYLNLSNNMLTDLEWLHSLSDKPLTMLDLTHNAITTLTSSVFKNLVKLTWLSLSDNEITVVESFSFKALRRLRHLDLSFNQLSEKVGLQNDCLNDLKHLHHLALAGNRAVRRIPHFHRMGFPRNSTTSLDLHGMPMIAEIGENAFRGFVSLSILNLSYCGIETIEPGWLNNGPMNSIRTLDLSYNRLKLVESHYFVGIQFDPVFSSENSFGFSSPEEPLSYIVSPNNVHEAVADFSTGAFSYHVTTVASRSLFGPLPNLRLISLRNNRRLSVLAEDAFSFVPALKYLFLQNCNVSRIKLASSKDIYEDSGISDTLPNLAGVWLYNNPIVCDCHVRSLRHAITSANVPGCQATSSSTTSGIVLDGKSYWYEDRCQAVKPAGKSLCILPQNIRIHPVTSVPMNYLNCPEEPFLLIISAIIGPITFAISIMLVILCGSCSVLIRRIRRYKSGVYHIMSEQRALRSTESTSSDPHNRVVSPAQHRVAIQPSSSLTSLGPRKVPRALHKPRLRTRLKYKTNMVLSGMDSQRENIPLNSPFHQSQSSLSSVSYSSFKLKETPILKPHGPTCSHYDHQPECLAASSSVTTKGFSSCPNIPEISLPKRPDFWEHDVPVERNTLNKNDIEMVEFVQVAVPENIPFADQTASDQSLLETSNLADQPLISKSLPRSGLVINENNNHSDISIETKHLLSQ